MPTYVVVGCGFWELEVLVVRGSNWDVSAYPP